MINAIVKTIEESKPLDCKLSYLINSLLMIMSNMHKICHKIKE